MSTTDRFLNKTLINDNIRAGRLTHSLAEQQWLTQMAKFALVGVLNTLLDAGVYYALTRWLGFAALLVLAKVISYGLGVINSYYWNKTWTFRSNTAPLISLIKFTLAAFFALAINAGVMTLALHVIRFPEAAAFALATGMTFLINFAISKFGVFKK